MGSKVLVTDLPKVRGKGFEDKEKVENCGVTRLVEDKNITILPFAILYFLFLEKD